MSDTEESSARPASLDRQGPGTVLGVSDTALWIAALRAKESSRPDAAFKDPLAAILAGERGKRIARSIPRPAMVHWGVVARTTAIDRLLLDAVADGVDTVINLGAGLDTRPYRMNLPASLRWIELDFPGVVAAKEARLAAYPPVCRLERSGVDLSDAGSRNDVFDRLSAGSANALIISEGVLSYLSNADVASLSSDLLQRPAFRAWIQDFDNAGTRSLPRGWGKKLKAAPFKFDVPDWFEFFRQHGWQAEKIITNLEQSESIGRPYPLDFPYGLMVHALPKEVSRKILGLSGAVLMRKVS